MAAALGVRRRIEFELIGAGLVGREKQPIPLCVTTGGSLAIISKDQVSASR